MIDDNAGSLRDKLSTIPAPEHLRQRIRASLESRELLESKPTPRRAHAWYQAAAALLLFAGGVSSAEFFRRSTAPTVAHPQYALMLYGGDDPVASDKRRARIREYIDWAKTLESRGHNVTGEELGEIVAAIGTASEPSTAKGTTVAGFFLVTAGSDEEIQAIAQTSPHVRHGGSVVIQRVR